MIEIDSDILNFINDCEKDCLSKFQEIEAIEFHNQLKVLNAFNKNHIQAYHFIGSSGYGHNDIGKEKISSIFKDIFNTEDAFVSPLISCGTEAISQTLFGILRPNDCMLSISGTPYDTLKQVIWGVEGKNVGSLKDYNIAYYEVPLVGNDFNEPEIVKAILKYNPKIVYIQRSRGYSLRNALSIKQIEDILKVVKKYTKAYVVVDNCYGEFTEEKEPTDVGADLVVGSLLKNMGGGIAPTGGYIAGKQELIELISYKLTSPALGVDTGSYEAGYKSFFQGVFVSPHVVAQAKKLVVLASVALSKLGYETVPKLTDTLADIVCCIKFNDKDKLINFTRAIQQASAIDSDSVLEAGEMDGYEDLIIMASGSFNQGSSIELSCDGPMREPYAGYLQGCLSYQHGKIGLINAIKTLIK
ncbi:MAG TPA: methionine gamma-lyase family protein [Candidatus Onthoplasma faecigallinarum]|nr:methionine gamma-lyase family protein [Candidatus Onthoplasma faecigallinarum]